jgi:hypothetical protein
VGAQIVILGLEGLDRSEPGVFKTGPLGRFNNLFFGDHGNTLMRGAGDFVPDDGVDGKKPQGLCRPG